MLKKLGYRNHESLVSIDDVGMGRLARTYSKAVQRRKAEDLEKERAFDLSSFVPHIEVAKKKLAEAMRVESDNMSGHLPVTSVFDALQVVKAQKDVRKSAGLRALGSHLQQMWRKDRTASLSANTFLNLKDYYTRNYPKSRVAEVFDEIAQKGYFSLPLSDLMHIASQIETQEDFDYMMMRHGLDGRQPHQVKARKFILAALNGEAEESQEGPQEKRRARRPFVGNARTALKVRVSKNFRAAQVEDYDEDYDEEPLVTFLPREVKYAPLKHDYRYNIVVGDPVEEDAYNAWAGDKRKDAIENYREIEAEMQDPTNVEYGTEIFVYDWDKLIEIEDLEKGHHKARKVRVAAKPRTVKPRHVSPRDEEDEWTCLGCGVDLAPLTDEPDDDYCPECKQEAGEARYDLMRGAKRKVRADEKPNIIGNLGDVDFITYGGLLVVDTEYGPEGWYIENDMDWNPDVESEFDATWTIYRFAIEKFRREGDYIVDDINWPEGKQFSSVHGPWFMKHMDSIASTIGADPEELTEKLLSEDPVERAWVYDAVIGWGGPFEFDSYGWTLNYKEVHELFGEEYDEDWDKPEEEEEDWEDEREAHKTSQTMIHSLGMDAFTEAYLEALFWAEMDDNEEPLENNYTFEDLDVESLKKVIEDCEKFEVENAELLEESGLSNEQAGHDFYLTRQGHGAGFWDRDLPGDTGEKLTEASDKFGEFYVYVGDDGKLYVQ